MVYFRVSNIFCFQKYKLVKSCVFIDVGDRVLLGMQDFDFAQT